MTAAHLFTTARRGQPLHFAAHSHHLWPDVSREAQAAAWHDAATLADSKWVHIFEVVLAEAQAHIAGRLRLPDAATIAVATNTHELVTRLVSGLPDPAHILTTDGEFHSFRRQLARWEESARAQVTRITVEPFATFPARFLEAATAGSFDLVYLSQVMFDSGYAVPELSRLVAALPPDPEVVVDGYHGFMALPTDLSPIADRAFYVAGGYKYAMAGEGACFMHCPPGRIPRPVDTGWYAGFAALEERSSGVTYGAGGSRFLGATFDPAAWYRFNAVQRMLNRHGLSVEVIHEHVRMLQERFLRANASGMLGELVDWNTAERGHFLAFVNSAAGDVHRAVQARGVVVDRRGDRLRVGFGIYHDRGDVDALIEVLDRLAGDR